MEKITLVVPIYNVEKYLDECLESIVAQTFKDFKCILVNDGATDNSFKIIEKFVNKYPELFSVINKENGGLSDARNAGIKTVKTKYVAFLDSDDVACPDFLEVLYNSIEKSEADIAEAGFIKFYEDGREYVEFPILQGVTNLKETPQKMCEFSTPAWNKIYKTELFIKNNIFYPKGLIFEDSATTPRLLARSCKVCSVHHPVLKYRQRAGSIMATLDNRVFNLTDIAKLLLDDEALSKMEEIQHYFIITKIQSLIMKLSVVKENTAKQREAFEFLNKNLPNWRKNRIWNSMSKGKIKSKIFQTIFKTQNLTLLNFISARGKKN